MRVVVALLGLTLAACGGAVTSGRGTSSPAVRSEQAVASARFYHFAPVVRGLRSPVYVTSAPGDPATLYVVEQAGTIRIVRGGRLAGIFLDLRDRVRSGGEQGLLSLAFHPQYPRNHRFYVDYTDASSNTNVVEFRSSKGLGLRSSARRLLLVPQPYANHNGGQLQFDGRGYLYVGMGDGGSGGDPEDRAQRLDTRLGKLLRTKPLRRVSWQIVGYGLRNPWRFSFDRGTGSLWIGDVGQGAWEEIDFRTAGAIGSLANYGWNRFEGDTVYDAGNPLNGAGELVSPVAVYSHGSGNCSVTGGYVYRGAEVARARGRYFYGDYCSGRIWSFPVGAAGRAGAPKLERQRLGGLTSFGEDGRGNLYATASGGTLYALRP
jgi:glucose/arabinose dehydrogenase